MPRRAVLFGNTTRYQRVHCPLKMEKLLFFSAAVALLFSAPTSAVRAPLYGFSNVTGLISVDPATGKATPIGSPLPTELEAQQLSAIDVARNRLYMSGFSERTKNVNILGFDLSTGDVAVTIELPFAPDGLVGVGTYIDVDPATGDLYATGPEWRIGSKGERHVVLRIDAANPTADPTAVGVIPKGLDVLGGDSTFDSKNRIVWCFFGAPEKDRSDSGIDLFGVHVDSGEVETLQTAAWGGYGLTTLNFDASTERIYGLSLRSGNATAGEPSSVRQLLFIDANDSSREVQLAGEQSNYILQAATIATIDEGARLHLSYMQPLTNSSDPLADPFSLVAIDADTGAVVDAQQVNDYFSLPSSLEAYNQ
jgi:hypothetical protein